MTKPVVALALFGIGQHAVRLGGLFELLFCRCVVWILVRMMHDCEPPVGALDLLIRRGAADSKNFVIITFAHKLLSNYLCSLIFLSVQPLCSLCLCFLGFRGKQPQRHREHRGCTEKQVTSYFGRCCVRCVVQHCGCELPGYSF